MNMKQYLSLGLCILLSACGTMYSAPTSGPQAKLRVVAKSADGYFALTRDITQTCSRDSPNFPMIGGDSKADPELLGMPGSSAPGGDKFERRITANAPLALTASTLYRVGFGQVLAMATVIGQAHYQATAWTCNVKVEFTPSEGAQYEMTYDFAPGKCDVHLDTLEMSGEAVTRTAVPIKTSPASCGTVVKGS
jgi:hypothetical protein